MDVRLWMFSLPILAPLLPDEKLQQEMEAKKAAYIEQTLRRDIAEKQETARAEQDKVMKDLDYELRQAELAADIELAKTIIADNHRCYPLISKGEVGAALG